MRFPHVGALIKERRIEQHLTQEELADRLRTTRYSVSQLENERRSLSVPMARMVARVFGETPYWWLLQQVSYDTQSSPNHTIQEASLEKALILEPAEREVLADVLTSVLGNVDGAIHLRSYERTIIECIRNDCKES